MKIAAVQFRATPFEVSVNRDRLASLVARAAQMEAGLVVLPELAVTGYALDAARLSEAAELPEGETVSSWVSLSAQHNVLIAGGFCERASDGRLFNSAVLVDAGGIVLHYRKLHLFDREKEVFSPGDKGLPVAETNFGRIGLCVCYDLRFVEVLRLLALQGASLAAVPTAWVEGFDKTPRDAEGYIPQARGAALQSNLNQIYVACASLSGTAGKQRFLGSSLIVDPYGRLLAGPLSDDAEEVIVAEYGPGVAMAAQNRSARINPRQDRRSDVYAIKLFDELL